MPFESEAQRRWMYANKPEMAKRWEAHTPKGKKLPKRVGKKKRKKKQEKSAADVREVLAALIARVQAGESVSDILGDLRPEKPALTIPGLSVDTEEESPKMKSKDKPMDKRSAAASTLSRLERLDLKGVGPDMLQAIANRDVQTVMGQPIILQRTGERLERIRRLKDELKVPGSHLKPEKPKKVPPEAAAEEMMPPTSHLPVAPGSPMPPSNLLGMFSPEQMGQMPKMSAARRRRSRKYSKALLDELHSKMPKSKFKALQEQFAEDKRRGLHKRAGELEDDDSLVSFPGADEMEGDPSPDQVKALLDIIGKTGGNVSDDVIHDKAESMGIEPDAAEESLYKVLGSLLGGKNDVIPGGLAAGMPTSMFPKDQIEKGTEVELEHTSNPAVAQEIAKDHLTEGDDYYEPRLDDLEENMEEDVDEGKIEAVGEGTKKHTENKDRKDRDVKELKKDAYKYGFMLKVAELGMTPQQLEKRAFLGPLLAWLGLQGAQQGKETTTGALGLLKDIVATGLWLPALAAPAIGAAAGGALRYATAPGYATPEEFRHVEHLATLRKHTRAARRRARHQKGM